MRLNLEVLGSKYTKAAAFFLLSLCWILSGEVLSAQQQVLIREIIIESVQSDSAAIQEWRSLEGKQILGVKELNHTSTKGIGDAIRQLPGVTLQGPPLVYRNASIMGLDKEFQTILIDGIRPAGGEDRREYKLDRIPTALIESVEYVNNPGVSWGSNAAVGLINIKVKEVPERLTQAVNISLDATSTYSGVYPHLNYFAGNTRGKWGYMFYADYSHHNRIDETQLSDTAMGLNGTSEEFGRISLTTLAGKLKYSPSGRQNFVFDFTSSSQTEQEDLLADITRRSQGGLNFSQDSAVEVAQRQLYSAKLTHRYHKSHLETESRFIGDYSVLKKHKDRLREKDTGFETSLESEDQNLYLLGLYSDWKYSCNTGRQGASSVLKWGIEMDHNRRIFDRFVFAKQADHLFGMTFWMAVMTFLLIMSVPIWSRS